MIAAQADLAVRYTARVVTNRAILIVDDDPQFRRSLARLLRPAGLDVVEAADEREALDAMRAHPFGVVVLDLHFAPVGDAAATSGERILAQIRAMYPQQVVLICSGSLTPDLDVELRAAGAAACISKPFDSTKLLEQLEKLLRRAERNNVPPDGTPGG